MADRTPGDEPPLQVIELSAQQTHDLRRRVLRTGTPSASVEWDGDDLDTTLHLGIHLGIHLGSARSADRPGEPVPTAISTWLTHTSPDLGSARTHRSVGVQLRGMATDPSVRGQGHGSLLLRAGIERSVLAGADHIWANARSSVLDFYVAHGFAVVSDEFHSDDTGIAHRRILLHLDTAG